VQQEHPNERKRARRQRRSRIVRHVLPLDRGAVSDGTAPARSVPWRQRTPHLAENDSDHIATRVKRDGNRAQLCGRCRDGCRTRTRPQRGRSGRQLRQQWGGRR
jgi:hypothetical protein